MLKIKDNIDLKELEKFGFKVLHYANGDVYEKEIIEGLPVANYIIGTNRIIHYNQFSTNNEIDDTLYELFKNNFVEEVKKNEC